MRALAIAASVFIAGCASLQRGAPEATVTEPNALAASQSLRDVALSDAAWPTTDWWTVFRDPQLDALMQEALATSPTLKVAAARTRKALAFADATHAALLPSVEASGSATGERLSQRGLAPPALAGHGTTVSQLEVSLGWELDFAGRNRSAYEAALGAARAAEVDQYAARLALSTSIAHVYVQLQRAYLQLAVAEGTLAEREQIEALTRSRNVAGLDSRVELRQAQAAVPATREQMAELRERIALAQHQLAALLGAGPDRGLAITPPAAKTLPTVALPSRLPAELLGRRPDLVAARWRIEAARAGIASTKAAFYPNVNLLAFVGLQSVGGANLLAAASGLAGIGPAVTLPLFEGGRLRANLAGTRADYDIAVEQYNQGLADALREVVDQLATLGSVSEQRTELDVAKAASREAYDLAVLRYREGLGTYLQVLSAEQPLLVQRSLEADLYARDLDASIDLIRALGGGYAAPAAIAANGSQQEKP